MKLKLFTVYDRVVDAHHVLFTAVNEGQAIRTLQNMRKNPQCPYNEAPHEFDLNEVGEFNDTTAELVPAHPRKVGSLKALEQSSAQA